MDNVLIKVGSSSSPARIAGAIAHAVYEGKPVTIRAIGASAVNQAIKSVIVARGFAAQRNIDILIKPSFGEIQDEYEDHNTTIIVLTVVTLNDLGE